MQQEWWPIPLRSKPDFEQCMKRIYAWFDQAVIDRPPVRFAAHNAEYNATRVLAGRTWPDLRARWWDAEFQVDLFRESMTGESYLAETFPVFWPNLGPEVYAAFYGGELVFGEVTSYYVPQVHEWGDEEHLALDFAGPYFAKLEEMTSIALQACEDQFLVGYSDLHGGVDTAAAWRDPEQFCVDLIQCPDRCHRLIARASADFQTVYDHFDAILKRARQPSVNWMGIPSYGKLHIPSCDFAALISREHFIEFCLPVAREEVKPMTHNIFHVDGKGVAKNLDLILEIPELCAIQYVQGVGDDKPIMQWLPQLKQVRSAGKSLVLDLELHELEPFMREMKPEGIFLCMDVEPEVQVEVLKKVAKWH